MFSTLLIMIEPDLSHIGILNQGEEKQISEILHQHRLFPCGTGLSSISIPITIDSNNHLHRHFHSDLPLPHSAKLYLPSIHSMFKKDYTAEAVATITWAHSPWHLSLRNYGSRGRKTITGIVQKERSSTDHVDVDRAGIIHSPKLLRMTENQNAPKQAHRCIVVHAICRWIRSSEPKRVSSTKVEHEQPSRKLKEDKDGFAKIALDAH